MQHAFLGQKQQKSENHQKLTNAKILQGCVIQLTLNSKAPVLASVVTKRVLKNPSV